MIKLWRKFSVIIAAMGSVILDGKSVKLCGGAVATPLGFVFVFIILFISVPLIMAEFGIRKLFKRSLSATFYTQKVISFITDNLDPVKSYMVFPGKLSEREEYLYYKYGIKTYEFFSKNPDPYDHSNLKEAIENRDKKHEESLIVKLAELK